jgi:hypothetical protein
MVANMPNIYLMRCPQLIIVLFWQGSSISVKSVNKDDANNWDLDW